MTGLLLLATLGYVWLLGAILVHGYVLDHGYVVVESRWRDRGWREKVVVILWPIAFGLSVLVVTCRDLRKWWG